ncbi:hypothetical protein [Terrisporobacter muris]|uniref:Uncharacterized protein n=1 Tax=Terrisporobacter muris TaxID=2963284 RepID=A0A9X2M867_9FIRM|nr:hypothetical protein [Terrisporobacter muris]MCR1821318.1 hypothetical protein [Terrisporobacter muris]
MEYLNAIYYDKNIYSLKEACREFVQMHVLFDVPETILDYFDSVAFIKQNKYLFLEESESKIIILSMYDLEDFDFIKGE